MHQRKLVARPQPYISIHPFSPLSKINQCPQCTGQKQMKAKVCRACRNTNVRAPIVEKVFMIEGDRCRKLPLTQGLYASIDEADYDWAIKYTWHAVFNKSTDGYYARTYVDGYVPMMLHHLVLWPDRSEQCDHINRNGLDNRRSNLRNCTKSQNMVNTGMRGAKSGYRGVLLDTQGRGWRAYINYHSKNIHIGHFPTALSAAIARDKAAIEILGEFAVLNFPEMTIINAS